MNHLLRFLLVAAVLASAPATLLAQSIQYRPKVSDTLPRYAPKVQVKGTLEVPGSDTLADLGDEWNRVFRRFHPEASILYQPKVSKDAVKELVEGKRGLILSAREMTNDESQAFRTRFGYLPMRIPVCLDAIIVFVHKNNPISSLSMEQLDAIFSKDLKGGAKEPARTWGDLGVRGELAKRTINAYAREEGSAIRSAFKTAVLLDGEFRPGIIDRNDFSALAESILTDPAGIAFGPMASWYTSNKILPLIPYQSSDARQPVQDQVTSSRYPMPRLFFAYVNRAPGKSLEPAVDEFLHMLLAREGQDAVADMGLFPGPLEFLNIALKRLDR
jgi:phosphate transport system substrate-binding protein